MCPQSQGLVQQNKANISTGRHNHNYSTFDKSLSYRLYNTLRFGEYVPSFVMEGVESDEIQLNSFDRIDSLSLKAPFKGTIRKIKESFMVPNMAILPMNWDRIYTQPSNGDDTPLDANCVLLNFPGLYANFWKNLLTQLYNNVPDSSVTWNGLEGWLNALMRVLVSGEYVYSCGSLLNVCGYKGNAQFAYGARKLSYDAFFDSIIYEVFKNVQYFEVSYFEGNNMITRGFKGLHSSASNLTNTEDFRCAVDMFRENPTAFFTVGTLGSNFVLGGTMTLAQYGTFLDTLKAGNLNPTFFTFTFPSSVTPGYDVDDPTALNPHALNLSRLLAYQLVCAHFYSNSSVDFIYSAELYRQYVHSLTKVVFNNATNFYQAGQFTWNGQSLQYDYLSGKLLLRGTIVDYTTDNFVQMGYADLIANTSNSTEVVRFAVLASIFAFRRSLRYGDYFVGSRPRPLAPINTDVAVNSGFVSVIDITRRIQAQRFANSVMRSRSKIENYVKALFGREPAPDYHNPFFLARQEEVIYGDEVQNTGAVQANDANSRTSNFAGNLSNHTFTFHNDDMHPCIYLQIISFDVRRAYTRSVERQFLQVDRFDMFNPDFQYIGDQPVYGIELGIKGYSNNAFPAVFGYQSRDMEYKQRFDQASGGFVEHLPGWIMTDQVLSKSLYDPHIDPDFIRSFSSELDQFYLSLTGYSLGSYFHFVCITDNNVNAKRAMAVDPQILG